MDINWFTVIAQAMNFLILVWLLKRFLYKPILNAIEERESRIATRISDAENKKAEAVKEQADFKLKNEDIDSRKKDLLDKAAFEANAHRDKLLEEARKEVNALKENLVKAIKEKNTRDELENAEKEKTQVFAIAKNALKQIASSNLQEQSIHTLISRINGLHDEEKQKFIAAFKSGTHFITVRTALDPTSSQKAALNEVIKATLGTEAVLKYTTSPELIGGIELNTEGYKLAWSLAEYLRSLRDNISTSAKLKESAGPVSNVKSAMV